MTYYPIDQMEPGASVVLLVTAADPHAEQWTPRTPVTVTRVPAGWLYESAYGMTATDIEGGPRPNPGHQGLNAHMAQLTGVPWPVESITESDLVRRAYRAERRHMVTSGKRLWPYAKGRANFSLYRARVHVGRGSDSRYVPEGIWSGLGGSDGATRAAHGEPSCRWIENPTAKGLRLVGPAHEVAAIGHSGHFLDRFQGDSVFGVVYRLAARDGRARFLAGYADPFNADRDGVGPVYLSTRVLDCEQKAARLGDRMAESMAQAEYAYRESHEAGQEARAKGEEMRGAAAAWVQAVRATRAVFRNRHRISRADARLLFKAQAEQARDLCAEFVKARDAFHEALETGHGWRCDDCAAWSEGYANGP